MPPESFQSIGRTYADEARQLVRGGSTTEASFYPAIRTLLADVLASRGLPFQVRVGTSEGRAGGGADHPDVAIYDQGGAYLVVAGEVKLPGTDLAELARSTDRNDQIGRYLAQTGLVLIFNVHAVALLAVRPGATRVPGRSVVPSDRELLEVVELWPSAASLLEGHAIPPERVYALADLVERAVTEFAPIADPSTLARILALQARRAKAGLPARFDAVQGLLEDYRVALGLTFEGQEGLEFFRSSLIQTVFYGLFAGWTLWHRENDGTRFEWDRLDRYLKIPFLGRLFHEFKHPDRLEELHLGPHLDRATQTLGRVDRMAFFERFHPPSLRQDVREGSDRVVDISVEAITYFYEPFLEAFDPQLRKELGVWYTPPEIVRYQVQKIDALLRAELGCTRGFADEQVVVLDPCCGTGAYLIEVIRCIVRQLREEGEDGLLGARILDAVCQRVIGFEILTAPFVIAQLQLYLLLADLGAAPGVDHRPAVFLTNALTGWDGPEQVKLHFPELQREHDAARHVKCEARVIVILGNPPYNRFASAAVKEEADLVDHYKGIVRDAQERQIGQSLLFRRWRIRKHLLDDLYIRFFRLAEKRIGEVAEYGIVSFISNSSFLTGRSHPLMRESLLKNFHAIWVDNLNGDKYRTGKLIPRDLPGAGAADQSIFTTDQDPRGIQVGTCVTTYLKRSAQASPPSATQVHHRDFWGRASEKRRALVESLQMHLWPPARREATAERPEGPREYEMVPPTDANRWMLSPRDVNAGFEAWPALDELFRESFMGVHTGKDEATISTNEHELRERFAAYLSQGVSDTDVAKLCPAIMKKANEFADPSAFRRAMTTDRSASDPERMIKDYLYRPLDLRKIWYDTTRRVFGSGRNRWSGCLVQRYGEEFAQAIQIDNEFLVTVAQPRRVSETRPLIASTLVDLHVHDRGSTCFPAVIRTRPEGLRFERQAAGTIVNLSPRAWEALRGSWHLRGGHDGPDARRLIEHVFGIAMAVLHAPLYQSDHRDGLAQDWAHLPIPKDPEQATRLSTLGWRVAVLLDPGRNADEVTRELLQARRKTLCVLRRIDGGGVREEDLLVDVSYYGAARGRWREREYEDNEAGPSPWGATTGDLFINDDVCFRNIPVKVWQYELGGYPVLKKWLGYRHASRRSGHPLNLAEATHLRSMSHRLAALLALHAELDSAYAAAVEHSWSAEELGCR